uniref:Fatty acid desaturase domain-containing protein n=1 Tax=Clastoptera arizonana TaxID=38151 RepID=A0A1B6C828_9HEMI
MGTIYDWVLKHRLHHKYHGTDNDPYNYKRGFQFAQIVCHCISNPSYKKNEAEIDMSDIEKDLIVMFQKNFYWLLMPVLGVIIPINAPIEYWGESMGMSIMVIGFLRVTLLLHASWFVNTATIVWGYDPLDKKSTDTNLIFFVTKSLWPQYHYLLPWDYKSGEYGTYGAGCSTAFIRVWAALGLAYDLRTINSSGIRSALAEAAKTGKPVTDCLNTARVVAPLSDVIEKDKFSL